VLADLATRSGRPLAKWYVLIFRALRGTMAGQPDALELVGQADAHHDAYDWALGTLPLGLRS
jgi:hypothetical protein